MVKQILSPKVFNLSYNEFAKKYLVGKSKETQKRYLRYYRNGSYKVAMLSKAKHYYLLGWSEDDAYHFLTAKNPNNGKSVSQEVIDGLEKKGIKVKPVKITRKEVRNFLKPFRDSQKRKEEIKNKKEWRQIHQIDKKTQKAGMLYRLTAVESYREDYEEGSL